MPTATTAYHGHHGSDAMAALLHPTCGIRDEQRRKGVTPRDHARDNRLRIKEMQRLNVERRAAEAAEAARKAGRASPRYGAISSRVAEQLSRPASAPSLPPRPTTPRAFGAGKPAPDPTGIATAWNPPALLVAREAPAASAAAALLQRAKLKPAVPRMSELELGSSRQEVDFVQRNITRATSTPKRSAAKPTSEDAETPRTGEAQRHRGRVPAYLLDRKLEMAALKAEREAAAAPRECPEGTYILPEQVGFHTGGGVLSKQV